MRTICPSCETAYTIPDDRIGPKGRKVRCTRCGDKWRVAVTAREPESDAEAGAFARAAVEDAVEDTPPASRPDEPITARPPAVDVASEPEALDEPATAEAARGSDAEVAAASPPPPAKPVRIRVKKRSFRPHLPRMPVALTRFAPFLGPLVFATACLVLAAMVVFRTAIVAAAPGLAGFYATIGLEVNLRGLTFGQIETLREIDNGQPVLVVEGSLANTTGESREVPALRFALRDADAQELYAWSVDPRATTIAAGDRLRFRTRLVAPPDRAADLQVRFVERRNRQAGLP